MQNGLCVKDETADDESCPRGLPSATTATASPGSSGTASAAAHESPLATALSDRKACPRLESTAALFRTAIGAGVPEFNAGRHGECRRIYAEAAMAALNGLSAHDGCEKLAAGLLAEIQASVPLNDTDGAWRLRKAFDAVIAASR